MRYAWTATPGPIVGLVAGLCLGSLSAYAQIPTKASDQDGPGAQLPASSGAQAPASPGAQAPDSQTGGNSNDKTSTENKGPHFDILEYVVDGNTVLSVPDIEEAVYPFLGEQRTAGDVDKAREALEHVYQSRGFQTVQVVIPQQGVESGVIHLQVLENPVGRLRVVNSRYHTLSEIKNTAPSVAEGKVPNMNEVQKDIIALNQQADMKVTPRLKAGQTPGTVDVDLQVDDKLPLHGSVELNNQNNQDTTPLRLASTVSYDNLWQLGHSLNLSYQVAPENPDDATVFSGTYLFRLPDSEVSFLVYGVKSDSDVAALPGTDVIGKGDIVGARAIINLPGSGDLYQSVTAGIDRKDLTQNVITAGVPSKAPVLYYPLTVAYALTDQSAGAVTQVNGSINFALQGLGNGSREFDAQRFNALRQYFYFKGGISRTQPLPRGFSVTGKLDGQITADPLLSSEQFSMGGENSVRGYLEAERLGDYGFHTSVEVRSPSFADAVSPKINDWRMIAFFDAAALWLRQPLPEEKDSFWLAGIGAGTRVTAFDFLNAALDLAVPLQDGAATKAGDLRVHFLVSSEF